MKKLLSIAAAMMLLAGAQTANVQTANAQSQIPQGSVLYALPQTVINVQVTFEKSEFTPGPYARYAQKYLGRQPKTAAETKYAVKAVKVVPTVEADPSSRYTVAIPEKGNGGLNFLSFCRQGLIAIPDGFAGVPAATTFSTTDPEDIFRGQDPLGNLATVNTTLYKSVQNENGDYEKVPVQQSQTVEKSLEKKAEETANIILNLRQKRLDIITGDTDATFSGEAMQSALNEMARLEEQYMGLFYGVSVKTEEVRTFAVVPRSGVKNYTVGKMGNTSLSMEVAAEPLTAPMLDSSKGKSGAIIYYRVPATATCRVMEGGKILTESRVLVYQLGDKVSFPLSY